MSFILRHYQHPEDYQHIDAFLTAHYQPDNSVGLQVIYTSEC